MSKTEYDNHDMCFLARIVMEATTPLKIGSGRSNVKTDDMINRDVNGLPYIPATTLQGLMRHALNDEDTANRIMGWQSGKDGRGSWISISEARIIVDNAGHAVDGLLSQEELDNNKYLHGFKELPIRQHVRITHRGTAADKGKFDEEIVPKGVRFCFEMELRADNNLGREDFHKLLDILQSKTFRVGGGSRKGFGEIEVKHIGSKKLDFRNNKDDFHAYINKESSLKDPWELYQSWNDRGSETTKAIRYQLQLTPVDFILFSSGLGDQKSGADSTIIHEKYVSDWDTGTPKWNNGKKSLVIPASSVKGAIAHRTAYYYNCITGATADKQNFANKESLPVGKNNDAVKFLFGSEGDKEKNKIKKGTKRRGRVLFSDVIRQQRDDDQTKILNHVKIDRFTGGAIEGALYDEMPLYANKEDISLSITVINDDENFNGNIKKAFEDTLKDICRGTLPLGGNTNHGNGCFHGSLKCDGQTIYDYKHYEDN